MEGRISECRSYAQRWKREREWQGRSVQRLKGELWGGAGRPGMGQLAGGVNHYESAKHVTATMVAPGLAPATDSGRPSQSLAIRVRDGG
jgi:hypothetical protein